MHDYDAEPTFAKKFIAPYADRDQHAAEIANLRDWRASETTHREALEERLAAALALLAAPINGEQADVAAFGRGAWVYCSQHMKAHETGWCSISPRDKVGLGVGDAEAAEQKCRAWGFRLYADLYPND